MIHIVVGKAEDAHFLEIGTSLLAVRMLSLAYGIFKNSTVFGRLRNSSMSGMKPVFKYD